MKMVVKPLGMFPRTDARRYVPDAREKPVDMFRCMERA